MSTVWTNTFVHGRSGPMVSVQMINFALQDNERVVPVSNASLSIRLDDPSFVPTLATLFRPPSLVSASASASASSSTSSPAPPPPPPQPVSLPLQIVGRRALVQIPHDIGLEKNG